MEDHHVDRLEVDVWQHTELTSTNHSIGLILVLRTICLLASGAGAHIRGLRLRANRPDAQSRLPKALPLEK